MHETTALGAAIAAGFASGIWSTYEELKHMNRANRTEFQPYLSEHESALMYKQWTKAVEMSRGWLDATEIGYDDDDEEVVEEAHEPAKEPAKPALRQLVPEEFDADDVAVGSESD
jgi:glycerol kinase